MLQFHLDWLGPAPTSMKQREPYLNRLACDLDLAQVWLWALLPFHLDWLGPAPTSMKQQGRHSNRLASDLEQEQEQLWLMLRSRSD